MGKAAAVSVIVFVLLVVAGFANYERNAPLDRDLQHRPYKTLTDANLKALADAYELEAKGSRTRVARADGDRTKLLDGYAPADLSGKVQAFGVFQRRNKAWRDLDRKRLEDESALETVKREQRLRQTGLHQTHTRILRRLLTL